MTTINNFDIVLTCYNLCGCLV